MGLDQDDWKKLAEGIQVNHSSVIYNMLHHIHFQEFWLLRTSMSLLTMSLQRIVLCGVIAASIA